MIEVLRQEQIFVGDSVTEMLHCALDCEWFQRLPAWDVRIRSSEIRLHADEPSLRANPEGGLVARCLFLVVSLKSRDMLCKELLRAL